jgi:hypothetical protein
VGFRTLSKNATCDVLVNRQYCLGYARDPVSGPLSGPGSCLNHTDMYAMDFAGNAPTGQWLPLTVRREPPHAVRPSATSRRGEGVGQGNGHD